MRRTALAVAVHDPAGHFVPGLQRLSTRLASLFRGVGALVTTATDDEVARILAARLGARIARHPACGVDRAGRHRRQAVELALGYRPDAVLYSDLDHVLRWIERDEEELARCLNMTGDVVVVGRTDGGMASSPRRLRDTERIVNHIYELMTGRHWDLMFAIRLLSAEAARMVVDEATEESLANDVEWPLLAERRGFTLGYFPAAGLFYRSTPDFDAAADLRDGDPALWVDRVEIAARHARTLRGFLNRADHANPD